ncbi:hypothetical protein [Thiohalocapsa marina]|uniref:hypothetical protein n=1 Tax=Thiohalocapsa marina TaxID=424902 RepID=UPI0036DB1979
MLLKFLVTAAVVYVVFLVLRNRRREADGSGPAVPVLPGWLPPGSMRAAAYAVLALMVLGSGFYLFQRWEHAQQVVEVQVVNPYSGQVQSYEARRGDIEGRTFATLDGRRIRVAEMERLIVVEPAH